MSNEVTTLQGSSLAANPFGNQQVQAPQASGGNAMMTAEMQRQIAEIQGQIMIAMHRPRNPHEAVNGMLRECQRSSLAECALYSFSRGGTAISGLSIRALEMMARNWQNIKYGFRVLDRRKGVSVVQAYAYDLESNVPVERVFEVKHVRDTRQGPKPITDERDIYELEANQAQRRVRACLEALMPGDVYEAVEAAVRETLKSKADTSPEGIKKLLETFAPLKINQKMIEARIQRNISAIDAAQVVDLRAIYNSIKDGMSEVAQWFDVALADGNDKAPKKNGAANAALSESDKAEVIKSQYNDICKFFSEATTVQGIDEAYNQHVEIIKCIKDYDASMFEVLERVYLQYRDKLEGKLV